MLKNGFFLTSSNVATSLLGLVRNILIARLIGVEDFGIAATFVITMTLVETASYIGIDRLVVQARDGDSSRLQATAHLLQAARGALGAVALFLFSQPLASFFGVPEVVWAYQLFALVPLLRGMAHLDMFRMQREMCFGPFIKVEFTAGAGSALAAVPLGLWLNDYHAMLYAILLQQGLFAVLSHLVAERRYRWGWDIKMTQRVIRFGWPLLLNGLLVFSIFQGDRVIVGSILGMTELGWFSAAFILTVAPVQVMGKTFNVFFLPQLSKLQDDPKAFHHLYLVAAQAALLGGVLLTAFFALLGPILLLVLYGAEYKPALPLLDWLAVMLGIRMMRQGPSVVAMALSHTGNILVANIARTAALPIAWAFAVHGYGVQSILVAGIVGEIAALGVATFLLAKWSGQDVRRLVTCFVACTVVFMVLVGGILLEGLQLEYLRYYQFAVAVSPFLAFWFMPELCRWMWSQIRPTESSVSAKT